MTTGHPVHPTFHFMVRVGIRPLSVRHGRRCLLLYDVNSVAILDVETGQRTAPLLGMRGLPVGFSFSPDGRMVLTWKMRRARLWDAESGEPVTPPLRAVAR